MFKRFLPFLVTGIVIFLVIVLVVYNFISKSTSPQPTALLPSTSTYPQVTTTTGTLDQLRVGVSTTADVLKLATPERQDRLTNGDTQLTFTSTHSTRPDVVIVSDNIVSYIQLSTPDDISEQGYSTVSEYEAAYGQPDEAVNGTAAYAYPLQTYIYSTKGFTLIVNPANGEVYEIQRFQPMSADNYLDSYGKNIKQNPHPENLPGNL